MLVENRQSFQKNKKKNKQNKTKINNCNATTKQRQQH